MDTGLAGSVVVVTGGSRGIGAATARAFAAEGARVVVSYRAEAARAEALAAELGGLAVQADVADEAAVDGLFAAAVERFGRVDVCVANAGIFQGPPTPLHAMSLAQWQRTIDVNVTGTFLTCRAFLREVARQGAGSLVIIGSTAGVFGEEGHADYASAKGAIQTGLLLTLKNEIARIAPRGRVNAVCPGWTATEMAQAALGVPGAVERATRTMPLRKVAMPEDVAAQVVVLASDRLSGHVSGQAVVVAGGMEGRLLHEA